MIDRGDHGAELLLWLTQQGNVQLLLGNHEAMLLACDFLFAEVTEESLEDLTVERLGVLGTWMENGGGPTLAGLRKLLKQDPTLVEGILDYLRDAPLVEAVEAGERQFVLVHGGLGNFDPQRPLEDYTPDEVLWTRPGPDTVYYPDVTVILGHTPTEFYGMAHLGRAYRTRSWIDIDTGAAMGRMPMLLRLDDLKEFY